MAVADKWRLRGFDEFDGHRYDIKGAEYGAQGEAEQAAQERLDGLNERQRPSSPGSGQGFYGVQDRVFVVRPDGTEYRFHGTGTAPSGP